MKNIEKLLVECDGASKKKHIDKSDKTSSGEITLGTRNLRPVSVMEM